MILKKKNSEIFKDNLELTIINLFFGYTFKITVLENIRFYHYSLKINSQRKYKDDIETDSISKLTVSFI